MGTIKVYKLFRQEADGLHPLFIDRAKALPIGAWLEARAPNNDAIHWIGKGFALINLKRQVPMLIQSRRPRRDEVMTAIHTDSRWIEVDDGKVYDLGIGSNGLVLRFAHRPGWHSSSTPSLPAVDMRGKVWAECLIPSDDYYILHRNISGLSKGHSPIDWYISQKIFIVRVTDINK